ncbi:uncharacterized protein LOC130902449 [Diorhabda carinulata]|uniref:uncharacterized protein LOC130902449 n=1 Tax=Diorhabda carinulata TaxID=1163345 RepID=UPI0025A08002|nr:uncharacterized protein LOC130902449 [Diorhabda carinulata]
MSEKWISRIRGDPLRPLFTSPTKNNIKTLQFYTKNYSVIPIVMIAALDMCWVAFCTIQGFLRTNIVTSRWDRTQRDMIELLIEPRNRKFWTYAQTFPIQKELYDTYVEMNECEIARKKECEENQ